MLAVWWGWAGGWERSRAGLEPVGVVCKGGGGLFPGIRAGASLKRRIGAGDASERNRLFPGIRAGASLKPIILRAVVKAIDRLFPGIRAGASLKRQTMKVMRSTSRLSTLPRHSCRGLIEAARVITQRGSELRPLPRHSCRGLIEARSAALRCLRPPRPLPRHSCRGLIEAIAGIQHLHYYRVSSPAFVPGPH